MAKAASPEQPRKRRMQQRTLDTRIAILNAALIEFAEKGFDGASTPLIAQRAGVPQPLIVYHFKSKEALWEAVADFLFAQIRAMWDAAAPDDSSLSPADRVRLEMHSFFRFTLEHPNFHQFMMRESVPNNPRLKWLVTNLLQPVMGRLVPQIEAAQAAGDVREGPPVLLYYALIGLVTVPSTLRAEIQELVGIDAFEAANVEAYWSIIERAIFT
jgi:TetR/AcrR family transcriptional regulator